jgi:PAS domain S-box-containing protein
MSEPETTSDVAIARREEGCAMSMDELAVTPVRSDAAGHPEAFRAPPQAAGKFRRSIASTGAVRGWRRLEHLLREKDERLAAICDHARVGMVDVDGDGRVLRANAHCRAISGYRADELRGRSIFADTHADDIERDRELFRQQVRGELDRYTIEKRIRTKDGRYVWVSITSSSVRDDAGRFRYGVRAQSDITQRKRAESIEERLGAIVESSDDGIVSTDLDGVITSWNSGAERLFGYGSEEAIGEHMALIIAPNRRNEEAEILERIRRGERLDHYETVRQRKDGNLLDISVTVSPLRDARGRIVGASKIDRDITQRREAEAKLRDSERQLHEILSAMPAAVYTTDAQGRITYYNQVAVRLAGREPTIGSDTWCVTWKLYNSDGTPLPHEECPMAIALREGRPVRNVEAVAERPDGTRRPFIPYPTPLFDGSGRIVGAINMLVDISERKEAETQQRLLRDELNHRVKNNMQMLQGLLHFAARETRSSEARRVLADASQRIAAMVAAQRMLYGASGATCFAAEPFLRAVGETARQAFSRRIGIEYQASCRDLPNDAAMPIALIVNELLTNAVKHGIDGQRGGTVRVGLAEHDDTFELYVEDDGPGFELAAVSKRSSGLGLVRGLARQLGATFEVKRTPATRCMLQFR